MRISDKHIQIIKSEALKVFGNGSRVYLFGSRVDDTKKGGDIDLLICPAIEEDNHHSNINKLYINLMIAIGIQKIDILVKKVNDDRPIVTTALNTGIKL